MANFSSPSSSPPPAPSRRRMKTCARRCERACCTVATYFPLAFVYSLTTWAVWVEGSIGLGNTGSTHVTQSIKATSVIGIFFYLLLNTSYTVAVFTDPGSPLKEHASSQAKYSVLPTVEPGRGGHGDIQTITVSSTGGARYCKKCHTPKPDRTHHCSTCKRCVLKMDHHCPWLATCVGLHNYKAFVLFLIYTSIFCWICLGSSGWWIWTELFSSSQYLEEFAPVSIIMLSVISGIIGVVLTGFTAWHLYLCIRGSTTIEQLEKTRYLTGVRNRVERNRKFHPQSQHTRRLSEGGMADTLQRAGEQILEFHANAIPGASRYEEGEEEHTSPAPSVRMHTDRGNDTPAQRALRRTYSSLEQQRDHARYEDYLDDQDSEKLPNAFDLGWRRNLSHLFGDNPLLWFLPINNTSGDGWRWEVSPKWIVAQEEAVKRKQERSFQSRQQQHHHQIGIRGGGSAGSDDYDGEYDYNTRRSENGMHVTNHDDGMSMQILDHDRSNARSRPKPKQKRDIDQAQEGGEIDSFVVSSDDDDEEGTDDMWE